MKSFKIISIICNVILMCISINDCLAQNSFDYQKPNKAIADIMLAPDHPIMMMSPNKEHILFLNYDRYKEAGDLNGKEILNLAGIKFNTRTNFSSDYNFYSTIYIKAASEDSTTFSFSGLPEKPKIINVQWSPDSKYIGIVLLENSNATLWLADVQNFKMRKLHNGFLNFSLIDEKIFEWQPDSKSILFVAKPLVAEKPQKQQEQKKPIVFENDGTATPHRTYQGLLKNEFDENLFDYYATSQLTKVDLNGNYTKIGKEGALVGFNISPDGNFIKAHFVKKPYSYAYTVHRFPSDIIIYNRIGVVEKSIDLPSVIRPIGRDAAYDIPRDYKWRADHPATLIWVEALDKGDPKIEAIYRDKLMSLEAPFDQAPKVLQIISRRYEDSYWINDTLAILVEKWWEDRTKSWLLFNPQNSEFIDTLTRFSSDSYFDSPGQPIFTKSNGYKKLIFEDNSIFLTKNTFDQDHGVVPTLEKKNLSTKVSQVLWKSSAPYFEKVVGLSARNNVEQEIIIARQSEDSPHNLIKIDLDQHKKIPLTYIKSIDEYYKESLIKKELVYEREDGITLQATLYYNKDSLSNKPFLPGLVYAYPVEFKDQVDASELFHSPYFYKHSISLQKLLALAGYAVLDYASFPIIGTGDIHPNDTYLEQITLNAKSIIKAAEKTGVVDPANMAIMGHSYGAFMVANLLTNTNLFKTGIAMSGAYNRSLTPFGFQREYRTYWEEQELYHKISPFQNAHKIHIPIMLIHGQEDSNPGTHFLQSERYFEALKGLGKTVRYIALPDEAHTYQLEESNLHIFWEIDNWLQKYLKNTFFIKNQLSEEIP